MEREILLFDVIEPNTAIMLDQRLSALEQSTARACTIRINSPGGSWNAGQLMRSRILMSKLAITTVNEGLVGSAATLVYAAGKVRQCQPHATFMMHQVSSEASGSEHDMERALEGQRALNRSTAEMYAAVSTRSADEWAAGMKGKDMWLNATTAEAIGFCTQILPQKAGQVAPEATMVAGDVHRYYMSILTPEAEMKIEEVKNALKGAGVTVPENATEAELIGLIAGMKNQAAPAAKEPGAEEEESELDKLKKQVQQLLNSGQAEQTRRIEDTVNSAVTAGKITSAQKDTYKALLGSDYTNTSKLLDSMPGRQSVAQRTNQNASKSVLDTARNEWDFEKFSKEDPKSLKEIKQNDPERYQNLVNAYIN